MRDPTPVRSGTTATRSVSSAPRWTTPWWWIARIGPCSTLTGGDRKSWLHTISSQHVSELPEGTVTQNLSLDGQGRVEDHWIQTELGDATYLDTEPWRGDPLLSFLRKMVFWADVAIEPADLAVLSLLGPRLADDQVLGALGLDSLPAENTATALPDGGFVRRIGSPDIELDLVVPRAQAADWLDRLTAAGVRRAGVWAYEALGWRRFARGSASTPTSGRSRTRWAGSVARCTWTRAATAGRRLSRESITWENRLE